MHLKKVIVFLGPPGSGKGTQAAKLSQALRLPHISTGDLFRENLRNQTPLGEQVKAFMDKGLLVPDHLVLDMLFQRVQQSDCDLGYLLDGFPRTIPQAEALDQRLDEKTGFIVCSLNVLDETIIKRSSGRRTCKECGHIYNVFFSPPKDLHCCDLCKGVLYQREDDQQNIVLDRLAVYHKQTEPLIHYYEKKGKLHSIDGNRPPDLIFKELLACLN